MSGEQSGGDDRGDTSEDDPSRRRENSNVDNRERQKLTAIKKRDLERQYHQRARERLKQLWEENDRERRNSKPTYKKERKSQSRDDERRTLPMYESRQQRDDQESDRNYSSKGSGSARKVRVPPTRLPGRGEAYSHSRRRENAPEHSEPVPERLVGTREIVNWDLFLEYSTDLLQRRAPDFLQLEQEARILTTTPDPGSDRGNQVLRECGSMIKDIAADFLSIFFDVIDQSPAAGVREDYIRRAFIKDWGYFNRLYTFDATILPTGGLKIQPFSDRFPERFSKSLIYRHVKDEPLPDGQEDSRDLRPGVIILPDAPGRQSRDQRGDKEAPESWSRFGDNSDPRAEDSTPPAERPVSPRQAEQRGVYPNSPWAYYEIPPDPPNNTVLPRPRAYPRPARPRSADEISPDPDSESGEPGSDILLPGSSQKDGSSRKSGFFSRIPSMRRPQYPPADSIPGFPRPHQESPSHKEKSRFHQGLDDFKNAVRRIIPSAKWKYYVRGYDKLHNERSNPANSRTKQSLHDRAIQRLERMGYVSRSKDSDSSEAEYKTLTSESLGQHVQREPEPTAPLAAEQPSA